MKTFKEFNSCLFHYRVVSLIVLFFMAFQTLHGQEIDILLKGGHVIDPKNKIDSKMDVAILNGKIFRVAANIPESSAKKTVDVSGLYVSPGIIDMHVHVFLGTDKYSS